MKAAELKSLASDWLAETYPGALIVEEFSVGTWGAAMLDLAAITEDQIIGVEIKGEGDSPTRIALQAAIYSKAATRMLFLACPELQERCFKHLPDSWGRLQIVDGKVERHLTSSERWRVEFQYQPYGAKDSDPADRLCTAPAQLLQCLWRDELDAIARCLAVNVGRKVDVETLRWTIAEAVPLKDLRREVCSALRSRAWKKPVRLTEQEKAAA